MILRPAAAALLAAAALTPMSPATAAPFTIDAVFGGRNASTSCTTTKCTVTDKSTFCQAVGIDPATAFAYSGGCEATLVYTVPRSKIDRLSFCAGQATGTFTFLLTYSGTYLGPVSAKVVAKQATASWATDPLINLAGAAYSGVGKGTATSYCGLPEGTPSVFSGRWSYVRV